MSDSSELPSSVEELARRCHEETERFFQRLTPDPRFCYELFRRALARREDAAFAYLLENYRPLVESWVRRHAGFGDTGEEASVFVTAAFEKLWQAIPPDRFGQFPTIKTLLHYLKLCAGTSVIDYLRSMQDVDPIDDDDLRKRRPPDAPASLLSGAERAEFWGEILQRAQSEKEWLVAFACFTLQMKPREVFEEYPGVFESVREIYRVKQNLIERLRRDHELRKSLAPYA
jgi:DNA-directed RNA polymerase specialized sigma24 family protein